MTTPSVASVPRCCARSVSSVSSGNAVPARFHYLYISTLRRTGLTSTKRTNMLRTVRSASSLLDYAILGHLQRQPMSGYAVRKLFATTPMAHYSDSPGSIYPALARLRRHGLVSATVQNRQTLRPRQVFRLTTAGLEALRGWVSAPVTRDEIVSGRGSVLLRFVFAEQVLGPAAAVRFLESFDQALRAYIPELERFYEGAQAAMPLGARLALRSGVKAHATQLRWVRDALREFRRRIARKEAV